MLKYANRHSIIQQLLNPTYFQIPVSAGLEKFHCTSINMACVVSCLLTHCLVYCIFLFLYFLFTDDHSRVVLQSPDDDGVDYINASYIEVCEVPLL